MKELYFVVFLSLVLVFGTITPALGINSPLIQDPISEYDVDTAKLGSLQIPFIENQGQLNEDVKFYVSTFVGTVFVTESSLTYSFSKTLDDTIQDVAVNEKFLGTNGLQPTGIAKSDSIVNYFVGDKQNWRSNIPTFDSVSLGEIWPLIDVELKAYGNNVEKIFNVQPDGNVDNIWLSFDGITSLSVDESGNLLLDTKLGTISMTEPIAYQDINGVRNNVAVSYVIDDNSYGFVVGNYDSRYTLVIDPLLASTFLGGSIGDVGIDITIDDISGDVFVVGGPRSVDFPTTAGVFSETYNGGFRDGSVSKLSSDLKTLKASTFIGGANDEEAVRGINIDASGNVYIAGDTRSDDFPTTAGAYDETHNGGGNDIFVSKLSNDLTTLLASTFLGGINSDRTGFRTQIAFDASGSVYVAGNTQSDNFPTTAGAYSELFNGGFADGFVSKLSSDLTTLDASTFIGGSRQDGVIDLVLDSSGNVVVNGFTISDNFPTTAGAYDVILETRDGFVSKLSNDLTTLDASTFVGGVSFARGLAIDDTSGDVFVGGITQFSRFPFLTTPGAYDETLNGSVDVTISKLSSDLTTLRAATFLF